MDPEKIINDYEKKHLQNIARTNERIREVFSDAIHTLTLSAGRIRFEGEVFDLSKYPALKAQIEEVLREMGGTIYTALVNSIEASWGLANEKNDILVDRRLAGKKPTPEAQQILYDSNKGALDAFIKRKDKGMDLSKRVWNSLEPFKSELEKGLALGISEGKSAREMSRDIRQFLNEPDKLFRRVRDAKGKLKLSRAAKEYKPGTGKYRSSAKNAMRLTRTETNIAYRTADYERWQKMPFVIGIEVKLSNRHPEYDLCDPLASKYPKDFKFTGWHPQCLCHAVPLFASDEDYEKIEDAVLEGKEPPNIGGIEDTPQGFKDYVEANKDRIAGWKSVPYWKQDNPEYFAGKRPPAKVVEMPKAKEFKKAGSYEEAAGILNRHIDKRQLEQPELKALRDYKNIDYEEVNEVLRRKEGNTNHWMVKHIDNVFAKEESVLQEDLTLFRGYGDKRFEAIGDVKDLIGVELSDFAYKSTTALPKTAEGFLNSVTHNGGIMLEIQAPKGTRAVPMEKLWTDQVGPEAEFLLHRNAKFRVVDAKHKEREYENFPGRQKYIHLIVEII